MQERWSYAGQESLVSIKIVTFHLNLYRAITNPEPMVPGNGVNGSARVSFLASIPVSAQLAVSLCVRYTYASLFARGVAEV